MSHTIEAWIPNGDWFFIETNAPIPNRGDTFVYGEKNYEVVEVKYKYNYDGDLKVEIGLRE